MDYEYRDVLLSRIDSDDHRYRITSPYPCEDLARSIKDLGLIQPPVLLRDADRYIIVSGFARIDACKTKLAWERIPAALIRSNLPANRYPLIAIADNTAHRSLNVVEQARAMRLLTREYQNKQDIETAGEQAGLGLNTDLMAKLKKVAAMPEILQTGLVDGAIALPVALKIHEMNQDVADTERIGRLLHELNVSLNRQREIVDAIQAITRRESINIKNLMDEPPISAVLSNPDMDKSQKAKRIRQFIRLRRFPKLSAAERQFAELRKQLKLKQGIQLTAPTHFESRTYRLCISFEKIDNLKTAHQEVGRLLETSAIERLWDLYE